ncbi:2-C-methyl-D-erythritol 4-phosphate cytidylyltransferase [Azohydromonas aeria]|uniref:2-C-methyl-D-erythritol 4-phosphate cytidylyltransferase n=1 Tax=Azohydromonas aeria TaxID=2590212 RepID=UPI0012FC721D|nr:2-C-methyl-D-erythritol 4-phosphate cytidylyltransferase [Azohydromonas aeria]
MTTLDHGTAPRCWALVPCAGTGSRSGADRPKQYVSLAGRTLVAHTLDALSRVPRLAATLVVLAPDDDLFELAVPRAGADARLWTARVGGATRAATVAAGLEALLARGAAEADWVLVHDAARCLVRPEWVLNLIAACEHDDVGGLLALPVADTLKQEEAGRVAATIDRGGKWAAQTPQMFRIGLLRRALAEAGDAVTDEASAVEALGLRPRLVPGALENFKLTWPADFGLAERLLQTMAPATSSALSPADDDRRMPGAAAVNGGAR